MQPTRCCLALILVGALAAVAAAQDPAASGTATERLQFNRDIRPILSNACFTCHGPDPTKHPTAFALDSAEHALADLGGYQALIPGNAEASDLYQRLTSDDPDRRMPPPDAKNQLTPDDISRIKQWIDEGAPFQPQWVLIPPTRPELPAVQQADWPRNPIDAFVLARLEKEGLHPSAEAARETLLRRLSLDLIGLPPTPEELDAFLADASPDAYERQVERLLASPHYGERWGRHWLDAARYADSDGYEKDKPRWVWMFRDWVVSALNSDLGYDDFLIDQLAGDLLPHPTQDQLVATGFLRNSMINEEGGIDPEQFRMEAMFDRMDAIGKSVLGLTLGCAQCHSHKYDPISQTDYYRIFAYFNDTHEASIATYPPAELAQRQAILAQISAIEDSLRSATPDWQQQMAAWEASVRDDQPAWEVMPVQNSGDNAQRYVIHEDGSLTAWGYAPTKWSSQFVGRTSQPRISAIRLEMLTDPNLPLGGPGRSPLGMFGLTELQIDVADARTPDQFQRIKLVAASADFGNEEQPLAPMFSDKTENRRVTGPVAMAIDDSDETAWGIDAGPGRRNVDRKAVFLPEQPLEFPEGMVFKFNLRQMHGGWNSDDNMNNNVGRFRFSVANADGAVADPLPRRVRELLDKDVAARSAEETNEVFSYWRTTVPAWAEANAQIEALWRQHPTPVPQLTFAAREASRMTYLLKRGDFLKPDQPVTPGVPAAFPQAPADAPANRLGFAQWVVGQNPTTSRAMVNRIWQAYFGTGFVPSSEDLGAQSPPPSHPELFDWLCVELMEHDWSLKHLHRLIVTSATYRQSSSVTPELLQADPQNRFLARGPRFRVEGEVVRDIALAASGLINLQVGGPPVYPPAPAFLFQPPASYGPKTWLEETGPNRYRRALYTFRFRSVPYPVLTTFDTPNGDASCVRRVRSNTPLQALTTLNEPLFMESARALALRTLEHGGADDHARLAYAFRRCTARVPNDSERQILLDFLARQTERFSAADAQPWLLAANDPSQPPALPEGVTPAQAAAWTSLARLLLNLDETITKE